MAITPLNEKDRAWVVEEAKRRAGPNATDAQQKRELYNYAQWQGKTPEELDQWMGYDAGTSAAWNAQNPLGGTAAAPSNIAITPTATPNQWDNIAGTLRNAAAQAMAGNLGMGGGGAPGGASGTGGGAVGAGTAVPEARLPGVGSPEVIPSGDGRWNGDPTRNPDGSYRGGNLGIGDTGYQRNPYLDQSARDVGSQMFDQWNRNVAPSLRSGAMATGGYGGSRQGVVEANALNDMNRNYSQALTGMFATDYTNAQNRGIQRQGQAQQYDLGRGGLANQRYGQDQSFALGVGGLANQRYGQDQSYSLGLGNLANQRYGQDQSYDLGLRNNALGWQGQAQSYDLGLRNSDLGFASLDANINNSNFNNQMTAANFGLGVQDYLNKNNQAGITAGTNIQNTGLDYQKYYNDAIKGYGNAGGTRNGTTTT